MTGSSAAAPLNIPVDRSASEGGLEAVKWLAFALMVADHVNGYLLNSAFPAVFLLGRLVFPLFAFSLAAGLAGRGSFSLDGTIRRLLLWACIAQMPWSMFQHAVALNVIFELAIGALVYQAVFVRRIGATRYLLAAAGLLLCPLAEFGFAGVLVTFGAMWFAESRSRWALALLFFGLAALQTVNHTWFALLAPLVFWVVHRYAELPRLRHAFYWMYPAHLVLIAFLRYWL